MNISTSVSQFRQQIADYISKAKDGHTIILRDEKKGEQIAVLSGKKKFDPATFEKALKSASGVISSENHPEWQSRKEISRWLVRERKAADRNL